MHPWQARQEPVVVRTYSETVDEYKQMHTTYTERESTMYLTEYQQTVESDIRYNNVVLIGITKDHFTDRDNIIYKDKEYHVTHVIEPKITKWNSVFLEFVKNVG